MKLIKKWKTDLVFIFVSCEWLKVTSCFKVVKSNHSTFKSGKIKQYFETIDETLCEILKCLK